MPSLTPFKLDAAVLSLGFGLAGAAAAGAPAALRYPADGELEFPSDYRTWV